MKLTLIAITLFWIEAALRGWLVAAAVRGGNYEVDLPAGLRSIPAGLTAPPKELRLYEFGQDWSPRRR